MSCTIHIIHLWIKQSINDDSMPSAFLLLLLYICLLNVRRCMREHTAVTFRWVILQELYNSKSYTIELWTKKISNNSLQLLSKLGTHKNKVVNTKGIWFGKFEACGDASKVLMIFNAFENAFGVIWSNLMKY